MAPNKRAYKVLKRKEKMTDVEGILRGDQKAFKRIYRRYRDHVYGFAYRMVNSRRLAEEVTHEAFLVLIQYPQRYDAARGSMLTFLDACWTNSFAYEAIDGAGYAFL